jgi:hypothetical protein
MKTKKLFKIVRRGLLHTPLVLVDIFYCNYLSSYPWCLFAWAYAIRPYAQKKN